MNMQDSVTACTVGVNSSRQYVSFIEILTKQGKYGILNIIIKTKFMEVIVMLDRIVLEEKRNWCMDLFQRKVIGRLSLKRW